jgi:hypothetical protein
MEQLKLNLRVSPIQGFEPASVKIEAIIPEPEGKFACITVDGTGDYYSSSCFEPTSAVTTRIFKGVSGGEYVAVLNVDNDGKIESVRKEFMVQRKN